MNNIIEQVEDISFFGSTFLGQSIARLTLALLIFLLSGLLLLLLRSKAKKAASKHWKAFIVTALQAVARTQVIFIFVASLFLASMSLELSESIRIILAKTFFIICMLQVAVWASDIALKLVAYSLHFADADTNNSLGVLTFLTKLLIWGGVFLLILDNLGVDITALVAGFGIGGIWGGLAG